MMNKKFFSIILIILVLISGVQAIQSIIIFKSYVLYNGYRSYIFFESAAPANSITAPANMATTTPASSGHSNLPIQARYLITPKFPTGLTIPTQFWLLTLYLSASSTSVRLNVTVYIVSSTGTILTIVNSTIVSGIPNTPTEYNWTFKAPTETIPANGYIAIYLLKLAIGGQVMTIYWGPSNFTNLQFVNVFLQT